MKEKETLWRKSLMKFPLDVKKCRFGVIYIENNIHEVQKIRKENLVN